MSEPKIVTDLFGDIVVMPSGRRGRPAHCWTKRNADRVILGLAMGYSDEDIASGLHISTPTLRKHYFSELKAREMQRTRLDLWRAHKLAEMAEQGNVGAIKELAKVVSERDRHLAAQRMRETQADRPEPKKVQRQKAAEDAMNGGSAEWGDLVKPGYNH